MATNNPHDRLGIIESERSIAILEDGIEKLSFLDSITPDILQHRDELSKFIGDEIARTLREQKNLEHRYEFLIEQRAAMKGMVNKIKYKEVQDEIQEVSRALRESTNNLVRSLKENPNISGNLIKVQRDRNELQDILLRCVQELRDRGKYQSVAFKVEEDNQTRIRFQQLKSREKSLRERVIHLQEDLNEENRAFHLTTTEQKEAIAQLKEELMTIKSSTSTDTKFRRKESMASVSAMWREFKHKEHQLESRVKQLEERLHIENIVNNETKEFLTRKIQSLQDNISQWENKYDAEVGEIDGSISIMTIKRNALLEKLSALQSRKAVDSEKDKLAEEVRLKEEENKKAEKALKKTQNKASRAITRALRSYIKRKKDLEAIKGDTKKAKGGKKDKKDKKKK